MAAALLVALSCAPPHITREKWLQMTPREQTLYVESLIGGEKAKEHKGGAGREYTRPAAEYVSMINQAYAKGDRRDASIIFTELADRR